MKLFIQKKNCDGRFTKKLRIGNSETKIVRIEGKMSSLNYSSFVKLLLFPYEKTGIDQQDYDVVPYEQFPNIDYKYTRKFQE